MNEGLPPLSAPTPYEASVGVVDMIGGPGSLVVMKVEQPTGTVVVFLTPDEAKSMANQLKRVAQQAASGLILPPPNGALG